MWPTKPSLEPDGGKASALLKLIEGWSPDENLAENIESAMKKTRKAKLRRMGM